MLIQVYFVNFGVYVTDSTCMVCSPVYLSVMLLVANMRLYVRSSGSWSGSGERQYSTSSQR